MTEKREVIRRLRLGHSIRQINKSTGIHRTTIRQLHSLAEDNGWLNTTAAIPKESDVKKYLHPSEDTVERQHPLDPYREQIKKWLDEKYSFVVIHSLLKDEIELSETSIRRYCHKHFPRAPKTVFLRTTIPGEVMEVDFGHLGLVYDIEEKRNRKCYVFSARLRHSRIAWRERVFCQDQSTFFRCHVHAFEYFGGVENDIKYIKGNF